MSHSCTYCKSTYNTKQRYDKHVLTQKHEINRRQIEKSYTCIPCNMTTTIQCNYTKHLTTKKHMYNTQVNINYSCVICAKTYKTQNGLLNHGKICKTIDQVKQDPNLVMYVMEQMSKQNELIYKQNDTIHKMVSKVGNTININKSVNNSHNKTFNLQFFLNEQCKDAINWTDFIKSISVALDDIDINSNITDKVVNTICKELDKLGVYKRPIHCTDLKRHKTCIKDNDEWKKEQDMLMKQCITKVSGKYQDVLHDWAKEHPKWYEDQMLTDTYIEMMNIYMKEPVEDKCINTILKHSVIEA